MKRAKSTRNQVLRLVASRFELEKSHVQFRGNPSKFYHVFDINEPDTYLPGETGQTDTKTNFLSLKPIGMY